MCGDSSVPSWYLEQHVSTCLDKPATQIATQTNGAATNSTYKLNKPPSKQPAPAPAPQQNISADATAAEDLHDPPAAKKQHQQLSTHAAIDAQAAKAATVDGAVNAFAIMTAASAAQVPLEATMFLEACSDGSWLCHWWNAGQQWTQLPKSVEQQHCHTGTLATVSTNVDSAC